MDRFTVDKRTTNYIIAITGEIGTDGAALDRPMSRDLSKQTIFDLHGNRCITRATNTRGILRNGIQHWLNIRRRTGNDAQDLARRRLLL